MNLKMKKLFTTILLFSITITINAQNPPSLKWQKIQTEHYEVIFPAEITADAQIIANKLENIYLHDCRPLKTEPKPI